MDLNLKVSEDVWKKWSEELYGLWGLKYDTQKQKWKLGQKCSYYTDEQIQKIILKDISVKLKKDNEDLKNFQKLIDELEKQVYKTECEEE